MRLNLGCGSRIRAGWINVDLVKQDGVDVVHDLDQTPWPWIDESIREIEARDVFEHVNDPIVFMSECHRLLVQSGVLTIHTPCIQGNQLDAFTDPTHKRFPTLHTFDYWLGGTVLYEHHNKAYGGISFEKIRLEIGSDGHLDVALRKVCDG